MDYLISWLRKYEVYWIGQRMIPFYTEYTNEWRHFDAGGLRFFINLADYPQHAFYFSLIEESKKELYQLLSKNDTVLDVGANFGETTLTMASFTGPKGHVYSFEVMPDTFKQLTKNVNLNPQFEDRITLINKPVADSSGNIFSFKRPKNNFGNTRLFASTSSELTESITLDDFVEQNKIRKVDLIKIDVEGFERKVIEGALQLISTHKPKVHFEVNQNYIDNSDVEWIFNQLHQLGYSFYKNTVHIENRISSTDELSMHQDIIALTSIN